MNTPKGLDIFLQRGDASRSNSVSNFLKHISNQTAQTNNNRNPSSFLLEGKEENGNYAKQFATNNQTHRRSSRGGKKNKRKEDGRRRRRRHRYSKTASSSASNNDEDRRRQGRRTSLLFHEEKANDEEKYDPRDEDQYIDQSQNNGGNGGDWNGGTSKSEQTSSSNNKRRKSSTKTKTSRNPIPASILFQPYSYVPLDNIDLWNWRNLMNDVLLGLLIQNYSSKSKTGHQYPTSSSSSSPSSSATAVRLNRLNVRDSIGWTSRKMCALLNKSFHLTSINMSRCKGCDDRLLASIAKHCSVLASLKVAHCRSLTGKGLLAIAEGAAGKKLKEFDICGTNLATSSDGGRLFIAAVCVKCSALKILSMSDCRGLCVGAFESVLATVGNILVDKVATAKLPSIQVLDVAHLSGSSAGGSAGGSNDKGLSEGDIEGVLLCIHKNIHRLNLNQCYTLTDDALRSICHKKTSWGHTSHSGSVRVHTLSLVDCSLLSDVAMGWISTGCPNVEVLDISGCRLLTDWGLRALNRMPQMRVLRLSNIPNITVKGFKMLLIGEPDAPATTGQSMYELDLSNCSSIQPEPCLRLLSKKCPVLTTLFVQGVVDVEIDWKVLQVLVKNCKYLRNIKMGPSHFIDGRSSNKRKRKQQQNPKKSFPSLSNMTFSSSSSSSSSSILHWPSSRGLEYVTKYLRTTMLHLDISGTPVLSSALKELKTMNHLLTLNLRGCIYLDNQVFSVLPNWKLELLDVSYIPTLTYKDDKTKHGLNQIYTCAELHTLKMNGNAHVNNANLVALLNAHLPKLHTLEVQDCPKITAKGSLLEIIAAKPLQQRIVIKTTSTKRATNQKNKTSPSSSTTAVVVGFAPSITCEAENHQAFYRAQLRLEGKSVVVLQRWWKNYIRKVLILRKAKIEKIKKKINAVTIQRVARGCTSRYKTKQIVRAKTRIVQRLEVQYLLRCDQKRKRKALSFFKNRTLALYYHQWIDKMQEAKHARGEQSEMDRVIRATKQFFGRLTDRYFQKWLMYAWTSKRRHGLVGKALEFAGKRIEKRWLLVWHENVFAHVKRRREKLSTILMLCIPPTHDNSRHSRRQQQEARIMWTLQLENVWFRTWKKRALEQRQALRRRARKVYKSYISRVLKEWLVIAKILLEEKRKFKAIVQRMKYSKAIRMLHAWQGVAFDLRDTRKALALFTMGLQRSIMIMWKNKIADIKYYRSLVQKGARHHDRTLQQQGVSVWLVYLVNRRTNRKNLLRALRLLRNRLAVQSIEIWRKFIVYKHDCMKRAIGRARHSKMSNAFLHWLSIAAGRLERIRCAILLQSVARGWHYWKRWPGELSAYKWATGVVQAAWRGRVGRKLYTKQVRHELLGIYKQQEAENDLMEIEDKREKLIQKIHWAAATIQKRARGIEGRGIAAVARAEDKLRKAQQFNLDQKRFLKEAEEKQRLREEENMLRWLASMRLQSWWRGCLGKKAFRAAKFLVKITNCAILVQANFRALKARRKAAGKKRMKMDMKQSLQWRAQQGLAMRYLKLKQRRTQRFGYRFMKPLGLVPMTYNFTVDMNYGLLHEIQLDFVLFKMILSREKEVLQALLKNKNNKQTRVIRLQWSKKMDIAADRLVKQHDAVRIVRHMDASLIGRTAYVLKIDETYGVRGMAEVKMDDDGTLQYVPIISEVGGLEAEGNGCVKIPHHKFLNMPGNVTVGWRHKLRLLAEFEVENYNQHHNASLIQKTARAWVQRIYYRRDALMDKCNVLTHHAIVLNQLREIHVVPSTRVRFIMANLFIMRNGGSGEYKYKFLPAMEPRRMISRKLGDAYQQFRRRRAITQELKVLMYKRKVAIRKLYDQNPTSVVPFVRSGVRRWFRIKNVKNKELAIKKTIQRNARLKKKQEKQRNVVVRNIAEMDYLGQVVKDAHAHEGQSGEVKWNENYQKEVQNLKLVTRPKLSRKEIKRIFQLYDTDGGGTIDRNELQVLAYSLGEIWDDERLDQVMAEIDTDGGGDIDFEEFCFWFQNSLETMEERGANLSNGTYALKAKLLRRYFAGTLVRKFKAMLNRLPAGFRYMNVFGGSIGNQMNQEIIPEINNVEQEEKQGESKTVTFADHGEDLLDGASSSDDNSGKDENNTKFEEDEWGGETKDNKKQKNNKKNKNKKKKKKKKKKKFMVDWQSSRPLNYEVDAMTTQLILEDKKAGADVRLAFAWADAWFFGQLSPSMYTASSDGYCIVHGEWESLNIEKEQTDMWKDPHTRDVDVTASSSSSSFSPTIKIVQDEHKSNDEKQQLTAYRAAQQSDNVDTDANLDLIQYSIRNVKKKSKLQMAMAQLVCSAKSKRNQQHNMYDYDEEEQKNHNNRPKKHYYKRRVPHGPGTALFPVPRTDWKQKGQNNASDFGRLVVGDFHLWKTDLLDLCFTHHLYEQFKLRLATELATALDIGAYRVKIFDVEDLNPYHDPAWMHRRCTMIYEVPSRLRKKLPRHLRKATSPTAEDRARNLVSKEEMQRKQEEADQLNQQALDRVGNYEGHKYLNRFLKFRHTHCKPLKHKGPPSFRLKKTNFKQSKFNRIRITLKNKLRDISNAVRERTSAEQVDPGEDEPVDEVNVAIKTYLSVTRVMFHITGAKKAVNEPNLDEVLYNMKRQLVQRANSPLLSASGMYTSRIVPSTFRVHVIGGHGSVGKDSVGSRGKYGFHAGVAPAEAHRMAELANQVVVEQEASQEIAEDKWLRYKDVADAEASQLEEELKDERREMEKELRKDVGRTGDLDTHTPRSVFEEEMEEQIEETAEEGGGSNQLDRLMQEQKDGEVATEVATEVEDSNEAAVVAAAAKAAEESVQNLIRLQHEALVCLQAFFRGSMVRVQLNRERDAVLTLILSNVVRDLVDEMAWLHEGEQWGHGGHGEAMDEEELSRSMGRWMLVDAPPREVRALVVHLMDAIVEEQGTELDDLPARPEGQKGLDGQEEKEEEEEKPLLKGSKEYERRLRQMLEEQEQGKGTEGAGGAGRPGGVSSLSAAHDRMVRREGKEGRLFNAKQRYLYNTRDTVDPYALRANSQFDGQGYGGGRYKTVKRHGKVLGRGGQDGQKYQARLDYRPWQQRLHRRTYWPEIAMVQGTFVKGKITGSVLVRYHDGATYNGPWVDNGQPRSKHHRGTWKTVEDHVYIGSTVDHHFDMDHITGDHFEVRYAFGDVYRGPLLNGRRHGWGTCEYPTGGEYVGQWFHDRRHGFGRMVTQDFALGGGVLYEGPWRHDKEHGSGRTRFPDGSSYEGEYRYGLWHGHGIRHLANGDVYNGRFCQSRMSGYGVLKYVDQRTYKGEFHNDLRHGHGELVYPDRHELGRSTLGTKKLKRILPTGGFLLEEEETQSGKQGGSTTIETKEDKATTPTTRFFQNVRTATGPPKSSSMKESAVFDNIPTSTACDNAAVANQLALEICKAKALLVPIFKPPFDGSGGVLKYRGDWGAFGGEVYNGPFVNGHEHGEAQWVVPMDANAGGKRMVRRGTWVEGDRLNWVSYPVSSAQTKSFVDAFSKPKTFQQLHAEMVADGFPHLPDGVDNTDPAVKMIVSGILRAHASTAGAAVVHQVETEKKQLLVGLNQQTLLLHEKRDNFDMGRDELFDYLDDIDERRNTIKELKRDLHVLNQQMEDHWRSDKMDLRTRYSNSVNTILDTSSKEWLRLKGMAPMKNSTKLVLEAMCIVLGLEPTFANAIVLFNDRDTNVKKGDRESIVLEYNVKLIDYLVRERYNYFQLCIPNRLKPKPDSRPPLEHHRKGMLVDGTWIKNPAPPAKGIWRLRTYIENLEFRCSNIKITKYGKALGSIIEWIIASYKCACFVDQMLAVENERIRIREKIHYLAMELVEEEEEMWEFEENYRSLSKEVSDAEQFVQQSESRLRELNNVLKTIDTMRNERKIPPTIRDDEDITILGTGSIQYHTNVIENVEPKTLWGGGHSTEEDGIALKYDDVIHLYSPTTRQVFKFTVDTVGNGEITVKEDILMVTEKNIHIRKYEYINVMGLDGFDENLRATEWTVAINPATIEATAGDVVVQGTSRGTLKTSLSGVTTTVVIQCPRLVIFDRSKNYLIDDTITVLAMDVNEVTETTAALENLTLKDSERVVDDDNKALIK